MLCRGWGVQVAGHDGETTWARRRASRSRAPARYTLCDAGMWVVATATRRIMRAVLLPGTVAVRGETLTGNAHLTFSNGPGIWRGTFGRSLGSQQIRERANGESVYQDSSAGTGWKREAWHTKGLQGGRRVMQKRTSDWDERVESLRQGNWGCLQLEGGGGRKRRRGGLHVYKTSGNKSVRLTRPAFKKR